MTSSKATQAELRQLLLARLAKLKAAPGVRGAVVHGAASLVSVFGYCAYEREQIRQVRPDNPALVVVLDGVKEIWRGDVCERFEAGRPFVVPAGLVLDMVNIPDPRSGRYESICITVDADLRRTVLSMTGPGTVAAKASPSDRIALAPDLIEAFGHAASALSEPRRGKTLARHRVLEILLLLTDSSAARPLFTASLREQVEALMRADPARIWRVEAVARSLGLGASTLRRRLKEAGAPFRDILLSTRMVAAQTLLETSDYSVTAAAQAAGYTSRSHFARRFREAHGTPPSRIRQRA